MIFSRIVDRIRYGDYVNTYEFSISKNFRNFDAMVRNFR